MSDGGKGSSPRPLSVDKKTFDNNWDNIFKKKEDDPEWRSGSVEVSKTYGGGSIPSSGAKD